MADTTEFPAGRIVAHFQPEAWINDYAVAIDPEGPQEWDATDWFAALPADYRAVLDEDLELDGEALDGDDLFGDDPAAPAWVGEHRGPSTITVRRT